ncbi:hypothetical protein AVEN_108375-1 [Araneus ventricosus]|uniref:Uncharacterized protein n=1 Tax=Araneus ventricosus TaxID=182803 RepID=A0A4Y2CWB5_ARAVE|nr:hypothetical protein AVEN_108375-1 [Araneus ventricosus]
MDVRCLSFMNDDPFLQNFEMRAHKLSGSRIERGQVSRVGFEIRYHQRSDAYLGMVHMNSIAVLPLVWCVGSGLNLVI